MEQLKKQLYKKAEETARFNKKDIELCHKKTYEESFTVFNDKLYFWFNIVSDNNTTKVISCPLSGDINEAI